MKLRILADRNPSAIYRYPNEEVSNSSSSESESAEENTEEAEPEAGNDEAIDDGMPDDTGNRLPGGGRSGNKKVDKFQGYRTPPMY